MSQRYTIFSALARGSILTSGHFQEIAKGVYFRNRNQVAEFSDNDHLKRAASWIARAQDVTGDGGVCGRYRLSGGWTRSYPETTGYLIPTMLSIADELNDPSWIDRAQQCVDFLLGQQFENGAFPGMEVGYPDRAPSFFNTGQIVCGLVAWHKHSKDDRTESALRRACDWLVSIQEPDGSFRKHLYGNIPTTYGAHATCWLALAGDHLGEAKYIEATDVHLDWILDKRDPDTGWIDECGFDHEEHIARIALTHTIGYTLDGLYISSKIIGKSEGIDAASQAAKRIARRIELSKEISGVLNHRWQPQANFACLTGNAQLAILWLRIYDDTGDVRVLNAALKAIDTVKSGQILNNPNIDLDGGIPGSDPIWGDYIRMKVPNWSAKFFIDALVAKKSALSELQNRPVHRTNIATIQLPDFRQDVSDTAAIRIVLYASPKSKKPAQLMAYWHKNGLKPHAIVIERSKARSFVSRLKSKLRNDGLKPLFAKLVPTFNGVDLPAQEDAVPGPYEIADKYGIKVVEVDDLSSADGKRTVSELAPDLAVHAGAGILRKDILNIPKIGTINAHMGLLPNYRGMNVAEWARLCGDDVGCTVHLIDEGIDTGSILCHYSIGDSAMPDIATLRSTVDSAQISLLASVVEYVVANGKLPPVHEQTGQSHDQYFEMHDDIREILEKRLSRQVESES